MRRAPQSASPAAAPDAARATVGAPGAKERGRATQRVPRLTKFRKPLHAASSAAKAGTAALGYCFAWKAAASPVGAALSVPGDYESGGREGERGAAGQSARASACARSARRSHASRTSASRSGPARCVGDGWQERRAAADDDRGSGTCAARRRGRARSPLRPSRRRRLGQSDRGSLPVKLVTVTMWSKSCHDLSVV